MFWAISGLSLIRGTWGEHGAPNRADQPQYLDH